MTNAHGHNRRATTTMGGMKISVEESFGEPLVCIDFNNGSDEMHLKLPPQSAERFAEAILHAAQTAMTESYETRWGSI